MVPPARHDPSQGARDNRQQENGGNLAMMLPKRAWKNDFHLRFKE
jgi:hypothetical protein